MCVYTAMCLRNTFRLYSGQQSCAARGERSSLFEVTCLFRAMNIVQCGLEMMKEALPCDVMSFVANALRPLLRSPAVMDVVTSEGWRARTHLFNSMPNYNVLFRKMVDSACSLLGVSPTDRSGRSAMPFPASSNPMGLPHRPWSSGEQ